MWVYVYIFVYGQVNLHGSRSLLWHSCHEGFNMAFPKSQDFNTPSLTS